MPYCCYLGEESDPHLTPFKELQEAIMSLLITFFSRLDHPISLSSSSYGFCSGHSSGPQYLTCFEGTEAPCCWFICTSLCLFCFVFPSPPYSVIQEEMLCSCAAKRKTLHTFWCEDGERSLFGCMAGCPGGGWGAAGRNCVTHRMSLQPKNSVNLSQCQTGPLISRGN